MNEVLLQAENVKVYFNAKSNLFSRRAGEGTKAVDGVSLTIGRNEIRGLVGESGSGKSTLGRAIMGLNHVTAGRILFHGQDLAQLRGREMAGIRTRIQMVFQDPNSSLPPHMRIGKILAEPILINHVLPREKIDDRVKELLRMVALPGDFAGRYPHQLSGGQKQRVAVARAMALSPELIVADEPTSALDVSVQAQILNLLLELKEKEGLSILFISHNLAVVRHISDRISVMKQGKIVEEGTAGQIFTNPQDLYTKKLLSAIPRMKLQEEDYEGAAG